jgi:hypothetical protein
MHCAFKQNTMSNSARIPRLLLFVIQRKPLSALLVTELYVKHGIETRNICKHKQFTSIDNQEQKAVNYSVHFVIT